MVALNPNPAPPGLQTRYPLKFSLGQVVPRELIIKTIAQTDNHFGAGQRDVGFKPIERIAGFIGRQHRAATPHDPVGFAQM